MTNLETSAAGFALRIFGATAKGWGVEQVSEQKSLAIKCRLRSHLLGMKRYFAKYV